MEKNIEIKGSKWKNLIKFVNSTEYFTRKEFYNKYNFGYTEELYLLALKHVGFVKKTNIAEYKRLEKVPLDISANQMQKLAHDENLRLKYFRKKKLEKINLS